MKKNLTNGRSSSLSYDNESLAQSDTKARAERVSFLKQRYTQGLLDYSSLEMREKVAQVLLRDLF